MALLDQALDHANHGANLLGGTRANVRIHDVEAMHLLDERVGELMRHLFRRATLLVGAIDDLVVHVGQILRERDLVTAGDEPATNHIEREERARIADVDLVVHGGAAHVHAHLALFDGRELALLAQLAVINTNHDDSLSFEQHCKTCRLKKVSESPSGASDCPAATLANMPAA